MGCGHRSESEKFDNSLNLMPIIFSRGGRKDTEKGLGLGNLNRFCIQGLTPLGKSQKKGRERQDKGQRGCGRAVAAGKKRQCHYN